MPKGYWIAHVEVNDPEGYKDYVAAAKIAFDKYGAKFLARGGAYRGDRRQGPGAQRGDRVPVAEGGAGLLPLAGIRRRPGRYGRSSQMRKWCWSRELATETIDVKANFRLLIQRRCIAHAA